MKIRIIPDQPREMVVPEEVESFIAEVGFYNWKVIKKELRKDMKKYLKEKYTEEREMLETWIKHLPKNVRISS